MCKLFNEWTPQIKEYCNKNGLSFEKAEKSAKCWSRNDIVLQHYDKTEISRIGLLDETPLPIVLKITKNDDNFNFEQTEYTHKYLSK